MNNLKNTLAGLALAGGIMAPAASEAENKKHNHPHHVAVSAEIGSNRTKLAHVLYTHEIIDHWSVGGDVGFGADRNGKPAGSVEAVGTFHKGVINPFYVVGELGLGAEFVGSHFEEIAKITGLVGMKLGDTFAIAIGPSVAATPGRIHPSAIASFVIGF